MTVIRQGQRASVIRVAQISDTHLSGTHAYFLDNFRALVDVLAQDPPDLVVHSGDVAFNAPAVAADLGFSRSEMERLAAPWRIIPGNHDVGEAPRHARLEQPLTDERIGAWRQHFGPQWWLQDLGDWRLVGLDTSLFASDRLEELEQSSFLDDALSTRGTRPVLLFMHMPPFLDNVDDSQPTTSCIPFEVRQAFLQKCKDGGVRQIACGHLHVYRQMRWEGIDIVWAPCTSFVHIARWQKHFGVFARSGYIEWTLDGRALSHRVVEPPRLITHDMGRWSDTFGTTTKLPPLAR